MKSVGIDLAGKEENPTGFTIIEGKNIEVETLYSDDEIIQTSRGASPDITAIDAPLSFSDEGGLRDSDSKLVKRGHRVLPPDLGGMKYLTERGIRLSESLRGLDIEVIEVHPLTSGKILFESKNREVWIDELVDSGWELDSDFTEHEIDSIISAIVGLLYLIDDVERIGDEEIIIPLNRAEVP